MSALTLCGVWKIQVVDVNEMQANNMAIGQTHIAKIIEYREYIKDCAIRL